MRTEKGSPATNCNPTDRLLTSRTRLALALVNAKEKLIATGLAVGTDKSLVFGSGATNPNGLTNDF